MGYRNFLTSSILSTMWVYHRYLLIYLINSLDRLWNLSNLVYLINSLDRLWKPSNLFRVHVIYICIAYVMIITYSEGLKLLISTTQTNYDRRPKIQILGLSLSISQNRLFSTTIAATMATVIMTYLQSKSKIMFAVSP